MLALTVTAAVAMPESNYLVPVRVSAVSYGRILSTYPAWVVSAVATISIACLIVVFTMHSVPDFTDPQLVRIA